MKSCLNCGNLLENHFCSMCGQSVITGRITMGTLGRDIIHFFTHMEKGFWFTSWSLIIRPGGMVKQFIDGGRIRYQKPVSYYLIWTAIYLIVLSLIEFSFGKEVVIYRSNYFGTSDTTAVATKYMSVIVGILMPLYAWFLQVCGMKRFYNYPEALTAVVYAQGSVLMMQALYSVVILLLYLVFKSGVHSNISDIMKAMYVTWFSIDLFRRFPIRQSWIFAIVFSILCIGIYILWRLYGFPFILDLF